MRIREWMFTEELKQTKHYKLYVVEFGIDVPMTQSQPIESTQGASRTPNAPRSPNPVQHQCESSAQRKYTIIRIPRRRQPDPVTPILIVAEIDVTNLDEATQMSLATDRSNEDFEAQQAVKKVNEHLVDEEIEKLVEGDEETNANTFVDEILNNQEDPDTRIEPGSHKESLEVEKSTDLMIIDEKEEEESVKDALRRKKGKDIEEIKDTPPPQPLNPLGLILILYLRIRKNLRNWQLLNPHHHHPITLRSKHFKSILARMSRRCSYMFRHLKTSFMPRKYMDAISNVVHDTLKKVVPPMVDKITNDNVKKNRPKVVAEAIRLEREKVKADISTIVAKAVRKEQERTRVELSLHLIMM
ncbi:hypothetical protein Tco_0575389 [Tanacetum coccineum]